MGKSLDLGRSLPYRKLNAVNHSTDGRSRNLMVKFSHAAKKVLTTQDHSNAENLFSCVSFYLQVRIKEFFFLQTCLLNWPF